MYIWKSFFFNDVLRKKNANVVNSLRSAFPSRYPDIAGEIKPLAQGDKYKEEDEVSENNVIYAHIE